ncbi:transmembrane protein 70 homolog, mitochondrial [Ceratina calcarata]|uniref:Transmembrane protein 70 homolog, mitochondrial n=1 Tax=Ceratina calcarata TaxID=156304 RepID=A0AAJ7J0G2_9HYME|nr:transmembrane protein 70 homolog, mitochondrial [Ceratina calcarata]
MILILRNCMLNRGKLFTQEIISLKRTFTYRTYNNVKKYLPALQAKYLSTESNKNVDKELIYTGNINAKVRNLKLFSLVSTVGSMTLQPFLYMNMTDENSATTLAMIFALANLIAIGSPVLVHALAKRYVLEMYYNPQEKEYIAKVYSFFFKRNEIKFNPDEVSEPQTRFTGIFTSCYAKNYPLLFDPSLFTNPQHYTIIMGYNKPIVLEVEKLKIPPPVNRLPMMGHASQIEESKNKVKI